MTVTGTIAGRSGCSTAVLDAAGYTDDGAFGVVLATERDSSTVCSSCILEIDYRTVLRFDGGTPRSLWVAHDSVGGQRRVATHST